LKKYSILLVVLGSILWGTDSLFRRPLSQELSPITIVYLEHLILSVIVLPWVLRSSNEFAKLKGKDWACLAFIAIGGSVIATSLFTYSIKHGNPSVTVLLQKTQPLFTILLARWILRERPGRWFWRWLPPALVGAYLVATPNWRAGFSLGTGTPLNLLAALGAACLWGSSTVFGRHVVERLSIFFLTGMRLLLALPVLLALFWFQTAEQRALPTSIASATTLAGMALIPGLIALVLYYKGLQSTLASLASVGELAFPVTAVAANWLILDIRLTLSQILGGFALVTSVTALSFLDAREKRDGGRETT
jgi:drug/metabolite transporter (DMT)-like permease